MGRPRKLYTQPRSNTAPRLSIVVPVAQPIESATIPPAPDGLLPESVEAWDAVWQMPQAASLAGHQVVVIRWVRALDAWARALAAVDLAPLVSGSKGQPVENPLIAWIASREAEMEKCERQLGIGLRNAVDLGVTVGQAKLTAATLNAMTRDAVPSTTDDAGWSAP